MTQINRVGRRSPAFGSNCQDVTQVTRDLVVGNVGEVFSHLGDETSPDLLGEVRSEVAEHRRRRHDEQSVEGTARALLREMAGQTPRELRLPVPLRTGPRLLGVPATAYRIERAARLVRVDLPVGLARHFEDVLGHWRHAAPRPVAA